MISRSFTDTQTRCLLLGASGFLGRHVHQRLDEIPGVQTVTAALDGDVDVTVNMATAGADTLTALIRQVDPTVVVNCTGATYGDPASLIAGNVVAVAALTEALTSTNPTIRLVHLGSAAEYQAVDEGLGVDENTPTIPTSPYGITKLAGSALVLAARTRGLPVVVLRVFNPLGPHTSAGSLPGRLVAELWRTRGTDEPVRVGCLDGYRDFIDVRDVAAAIAAATIAPGPLPAVLNIGSGRATALRDLAAAAMAAAGGGSVVETTAGSPRSGAVLWQQATITAAVEALSWNPTIDLATSVRDMWETHTALAAVV